MSPMKRRILLAAAATLPVGLRPRKPLAAGTDGKTVPEFRFTLADGTPRTLADYAGRGVVLNLWATWCVPCVVEMPALAALARLLRDERVSVLPLASDRGGAPAVEKFYREKKIEGLATLLDPRGEAARALGARGIPTTLLIDSAGRERGRLEGAADWANAESIATVRKLVER